MTLIKRLNQERAEYRALARTWQTIADLKAGASVLIDKVEQYLPRRACEDDELYALRVQKFSYTPIYTNAVRELVAKLLTEPLTVTGTDDEWWEDFYRNMDGHGLDEPRFMQRLYSMALHFGRLYIGVDRPSTNKPSLLYQLNDAPKPYIRIYDPLDVITWSDDYSWYVTRQLYDKLVPFAEETLTYCRWTLWSAIANEVYECPVRLYMGYIREVQVNGTWMNIEDKRAILEPKQVDHGLPYPPMICLELDDDEWIGNACYLKQLQHTRIESQWTEAGAVAGTIQRVFTPSPPTPDADERITYSQPDYSNLQSSNNHILIGNGFQFVESSGSAIGALSQQLNEIKQSILDLVSMSYKSAAKDLGTVQQSGVSKEVDMMSLDDTVSSYTTKVAPFYQTLLILISLMAGRDDSIEVSTEPLDENDNGSQFSEEDVQTLMREYDIDEDEARSILGGQ